MPEITYVNLSTYQPTYLPTHLPTYLLYLSTYDVSDQLQRATRDDLN